MAERPLPKPNTRVRFPSLAPSEGDDLDASPKKPDKIGLFCYLSPVIFLSQIIDEKQRFPRSAENRTIT